MTGDDEFIGQLEGYLETFDGDTPLPEHVRHAVHAALPATRQVRPRPGALRGLTLMINLSAPLRWGVAATAVVVVVALGAMLLNFNRSQGVAAAAPTPSLAPVVTPAPSAELLTLQRAPAAPCDATDTNNGCIKAGTYTVSPVVFANGISLAVPSGWFEWDIGPGSEGVLAEGRPDAPSGSGWGLLFVTVGTVLRDPCDSRAGTFLPADVDTASGVVAAMSSWPGFTATTPQPITIDGASGQMIVLSSSRTTATCPSPILWRTPQAAALDSYPMINAEPDQYTAQFRVLDVGGRILVIRTTDFPQTSPFEIEQGVKPDPTRHVADQAALHAMLGSIKWGQTATP